MITEKPFGLDLDSARRAQLAACARSSEEAIFRIDHYLGREAVQNLLAVRFANGMFEPVWNRNHIDHVQIDVPETLSIEMRAASTRKPAPSATWSSPTSSRCSASSRWSRRPRSTPRRWAAEREKVFDSMSPLRPDRRRPRPVRGLPRGRRCRPRDSDTETFVAIRAIVDNWRWEGVPFYLRSGKRLAEDRHLLTVAFKQPPRRMFPLDCDEIAESFGRDHLTFELGEPGSISASFLAKLPGPTIQLGEAHMRFDYADNFGGGDNALDPYERLIHDVMLGDRTLFTTSAAIERLWEVSEPLLARAAAGDRLRAGHLGPGGADR